MRTASRNRRLLWRGGVALFSRGCNGAFTMVEMLAVLLILTILVALAAGVGQYVIEEAKRKETIATQEVVMQAIQAYYDNHNGYPPSDSNDCLQLMKNLVADPDARVLVKGLDSKAFFGSGSSGMALLDAYAKGMKYQIGGGLGGGPVLISAGKDGVWRTTDDIRSDGR